MSRHILLPRRALLAGAGTLLAAPSIVRAQARNGVALVIGNSKYQWEAQLPNVRRDAPDIAQALQAMGLKTELVQDGGQKAMLDAIGKFRDLARGADFAVFYFAGHGAQWGNVSYLVPIDADLSVPRVDALVSSAVVNAACNAAKANMRIYDNCRNNPADGWRQKDAEDNSVVRNRDLREFAKTNPNCLALYSTAPERVALDGPAGQNSPFATALLRQFSGASVDVSTLAEKVRREVVLATQGQQVVTDLSTLTGPIVLDGTRGKGVRLAPPPVVDPSALISLDKAYALAREKRIPLPPGLVAFRASGDASIRQKVGSFRYDVNWGKQTGFANQLLIVLSASADAPPQIIGAATATSGYWRFVRGTIKGDRLDYQSFNNPAESPSYGFRWQNDNAGRVSIDWPNDKFAPTILNSTFERLDG